MLDPEPWVGWVCAVYLLGVRSPDHQDCLLGSDGGPDHPVSLSPCTPITLYPHHPLSPLNDAVSVCSVVIVAVTIDPRLPKLPAEEELPHHSAFLRHSLVVALTLGVALSTRQIMSP